MMAKELLRVEDLKVSFEYDGKNIQVVRGVDLGIKVGEVIGIIGESGSGKTVFATSINGIVKDENGQIESGKILYKDKDLLKISEKELRTIRGKDIAYVFQDYFAALNPYKKIGKQIGEVLKAHKKDYSKEIILKGMRDVGIDNPEVIYNMYPSQLSGGQCQRVMIAMCTIASPEILIADEPTTAIDASLKKKVLQLLKEINKSFNTTIIIITHDFDVAKYLCERVIVMYGGLVMEEGSIEDVISNPLHPYTEELLKCVKSLNNNEEKLYMLEGVAPAPKEFKNQCPFYDRCKRRAEICSKNIPLLISRGDNRKVRCVNYEYGNY